MIRRNLDFSIYPSSPCHRAVGQRQRYPLVKQLGTMGDGGCSLRPPKVHFRSNARPTYACALVTYDRRLFLVGDYELAGSCEDIAGFERRRQTRLLLVFGRRRATPATSLLADFVA